MYMIAVCTGPCVVGDTTNVAVGGRLVLLPDTLSLSSVPAQWRDRFVAGTSYMDLEGPTNGCFVLRRFPRNQTFAGIALVGLTHWSRLPQPDSISFSLYRSPDGGYSVTGHLVGEDFRGTGVSWHAQVDSIWFSPPDSVFAKRLGGPEAAACWPSP